LHLTTCDDCRELVREAFEINQALEEEGVAATDEEESVDAPQQSVAAPLPDAPAVVVPASIEWWRRRQIVLWGGTLSAGAAVLLVLWLEPARLPDSRGASSDTPAALQILVDAVGKTRYVEPRLTGGFAWAPLSAVRRSGAGDSLPVNVRIAVDKIAQRA
jgi:hypothetical protein